MNCPVCGFLLLAHKLHIGSTFCDLNRYEATRLAQRRAAVLRLMDCRKNWQNYQERFVAPYIQCLKDMGILGEDETEHSLWKELKGESENSLLTPTPKRE